MAANFEVFGEIVQRAIASSSAPTTAPHSPATGEARGAAR
jgi:hypothetical protein